MTRHISEKKGGVGKQKGKRKKRQQRLGEQDRLMIKSLQQDIEAHNENVYQTKLANSMISRALELEARRAKERVAYVV